jgi:hypothetical protein
MFLGFLNCGFGAVNKDFLNPEILHRLPDNPADPLGFCGVNFDAE